MKPLYTGKLVNMLVQSTSLQAIDPAKSLRSVDDTVPLVDLHRKRASEMFGVAYDDVTDEQRRHAKAVAFGEWYS